MADNSWFKINKDYAAGQPERNAKRLQLLKQEEAAGLNAIQEIQHQEEHPTDFSTPKTVTKETTVPKINYSPAMQEYFGTNVAPKNSTSPEGEKLNKEMTVPIQEKPKGWLNDYLGGVVNRVIHPLEAAGKAAQEFMAMSPEDQAMSLIPAGTFIGRGSALFPKVESKMVSLYESLGLSRAQIKHDIGLHRGAEGQLRAEISDVNMKINLPDLITLSNGAIYREAGSLERVIDHPELVKAYPGLMKNYEFVLQEGTGQNSGSLTYPLFNQGHLVKKGTLTINRPKDVILNPSKADIESMKRTAIHEIQHSIQKLEDWQGGANYQRIEAEIRIKSILSSDPFSIKEDFPLTIEKAIKEKAWNEYERTAGEVEARLASMRATMTPKELKEIHPFDMGEIPLDKQILRGQSNNISNNISSSKENFIKIANWQRRKPESAMLKVQDIMEGGVLNPVVEHVGDILHRMNEEVTFKGAGYEYVKHKVEYALRLLTNPYGFEKEFQENIISNAKYKNLSVEEYKNKLYDSLDKYANEFHSKNPEHPELYNEAQKTANRAAYAIGKRDWNSAKIALWDLQKHLGSQEEWIKYARANLE